MKTGGPISHTSILMLRIFRVICILSALLALASGPSAHAGQVAFTYAEATYDQGAPYSVASSIDGSTGAAGGWGIDRQQFVPQAAIWKTAAPVHGANLEIRMIQNFGGRHFINEFRLSYTIDALPALAGTWIPWIPDSLLSSGTTLGVVNTDRIRSVGSPGTVTYTLRGALPAQGITGLRMDVYPFDFNTAPSDSMPATLGHASNGNFVLSEFQAETDPVDINLALHKPATASGPLWPGFQISNIVDGSTATIVHPQADSGTLGFTYEIDLGASYALTRINVKNRADGAVPERLTNYRIELYDEANGVPSALNWSATIRGDGSNSGSGGIDTVLAGADTTPGHGFYGRYIRLINQSNAAYNPQVSEIEAYGSLLPSIDNFAVDDDTIASGESTTLIWQTANADTVVITPFPGSVASAGTANITPSATTTYSITATNADGSVTRALQVGVDVTLSPPELTEFQASGSTLDDEDDATQDWIEIHNPNAYQLDLTGYHLTDKADNLTKWTFPAVTLAPGAWLVVFASEKNRLVPGLPLHTNFKLSEAGEYLALVAPDGITVVQQFSPTFPNQISGISYCGGGYLAIPTPGTANSALAGPLITAVTENPPPPADAEDVPIQATIVAQGGASVSSATLIYRVMYGPEIGVSMTTAGGDLYGATIPAADSSPGQMIRWRITAKR